MSELQIKITLGDLDVFLQGDGELVYKVFSDIRENGMGKFEKITPVEVEKSYTSSEESKKQAEKIPETTVQPTINTPKIRKKAQPTSAQLLKDLDLSGRNGSQKSLKEFINEKNPSSNVQKTAAFVYYLETIMNLDEITIDHIFTCYKAMGYRIPQNLPQNITDTCSSRYGYVSRKDGKYSMTVVGTNYIEFDLNQGE